MSNQCFIMKRTRFGLGFDFVCTDRFFSVCSFKFVCRLYSMFGCGNVTSSLYQVPIVIEIQMDIDNYRVWTSPIQRLYYVPGYITLEEESDIIGRVNGAPKPKWTQLSHRRLQNWGGIPHVKGMIAEKLPDWLTIHTEKIGKSGLFGKDKLPNHVLINEYQSGQGIMPHLDGLLFYPTVTTISCGSHTVLDFYKTCNTSEDHEQHFDTPSFSLLLERRSLLVLQEKLYTDYLHAIADVERDTISKSRVINIGQCAQEYSDGEILERGVRISLTIRHVAHTSKFKISSK